MTPTKFSGCETGLERGAYVIGDTKRGLPNIHDTLLRVPLFRKTV